MNEEIYINKEQYNTYGCLMKIIEYNKRSDIVVEFQDEHKAKVRTQYCNFVKGQVKNPYHPIVFGVGVIGQKYITVDENAKSTKEYMTWYHILRRCFNEKIKVKQPAYKDVTCCDEWLCFENFYEWVHSQPNFDKWINGSRWAIDKDILVKGNKIYSPQTCCLVPQNVNCLFLKRKASRGQYPIGVSYSSGKYWAKSTNPLTGKNVELGKYNTPEDAFNAYKVYRENLIKQVADIEYSKGNISKECYNAMSCYIVEIND